MLISTQLSFEKGWVGVRAIGGGGSGGGMTAFLVAGSQEQD